MSEYNFRSAYMARPYTLKSGDAMAYKCVAVVGDVGDWAAYYGYTDKTDEQIARNGDKMNQKAAEALFPVCVNAGLRWRP